MKTILAVLFGFFLFCSANLFGQNLEPKTIFEKALAEPTEKIRIELDFENLLSKKRTNEYQRARLAFGSETQKWEVEVRSRGKFRRKTCEFPPIKVKFTDAQLLAAGFDTAHNDFKIVTHCRDEEASDRFLMREFLCYQILAQVTPVAMRARLVAVEYVHLRDTTRKMNRLGIILEDDAELGARIGADLVEHIFGATFDSTQIALAANLVLFEYMISNTDWSIRACRNVMFFRPRDGEKLIVSPYDFDFSGLVNAPYAKPSFESKKKKTRDRFWMGDELPPEALRRACANFRRSRESIFAVVSNFEKLPKADREDMIAFLKTFYDELDRTKDAPRN